MKNSSILLRLCIAIACTLHAATDNIPLGIVRSGSNAAELSEPAVKVGSGQALTIKSGGSFTALSGSTVDLSAGTIALPGYFAADAGSTDAYVVTIPAPIVALVTGEHYRFKANTANTGAATINVNGTGVKTIKKAAGGITTDLADNDIRAGQWVDLVWDGTNFQMQSLLGNAPAGGGGSGTVTATGGSLTADAIVFGAGTTDTKVLGGILDGGAGKLVLGINTTTAGAIKMFGSTSGDATITPSAVAGTATALTWPTHSGALIGTGDTGTVTNTMLAGSIDLTAKVTGSLPVANGGSGQTSYTNGQLLIGNSTGNTLAKGTLTGTTNQVAVTNGAASITLSLPQDIATGSSPTFGGATLTGSLTGTAASFSGHVLAHGLDVNRNDGNENTLGASGVGYVDNTLHLFNETGGYPALVESRAFPAARLTFTGQPSDGQTVVVGGKTYTFQTTLTNTDGHVKIGTDLAGSITNLAAAANLNSGAGTTYAAATTAGQCYVYAASTTAFATARPSLTSGPTTTTSTTVTGATWDGALGVDQNSDDIGSIALGINGYAYRSAANDYGGAFWATNPCSNTDGPFYASATGYPAPHTITAHQGPNLNQHRLIYFGTPLYDSSYFVECYGFTVAPDNGDYREGPVGWYVAQDGRMGIGTTTLTGGTQLTLSGNASISGTIAAGSGPTTLTDSAGKVLSAALNTVAVAQGGTGITSGTSGGVLAYTATGTLASSAALTQYAPMLGGGAGAAPFTETSFITNGAGTITLGLAGTNAGQIQLLNATSGVLNLAVPTGALGTVTNTFQAVSDTFVYRATTDTLTNKTLSASVLQNGLTSNSGSSAIDLSASSGAFKSPTGANQLSGAVTVADATTPSITLASGKTNSGFLLLNGKTSGSLKIIAADAAAQAIVISLSAQTTGGATLTIPDQAGTGRNFVFDTLTQTLTNKTLTDAVNTVSTPTTTSVGYLGIPQNSQSTAYTTVMGDAGKHIFHPAADTTARTWTIDSNANVAYPVGTAISFVNETLAGVVTIAITSDTLLHAADASTGSYTLAASKMATALKITSTKWIISP